MDESRKLYEDWFHSRYDSISMPPEDRVKLFTFSWAAWQASRAALEIKLPPKAESSPYEHYMPHYTMDADSVESAIRSAGIKVKE